LLAKDFFALLVALGLIRCRTYTYALSRS